MAKLKKTKSEIIALLGCENCGMHEPSCDICGNDFTRRNQIIHCEDIDHYGDNKHYCNKCNKNLPSN